MKERPILFTAEMVRAILQGRKTQTRRLVRSKIVPIVEECFRVNGKWCNHTFGYDLVELCPHGKPEDRLWVRETFRKYPTEIAYRASIPYGNLDCHFKPWTPSIFMRRLDSRITLEIVNVRVERLQEITEEDAIAEGVKPLNEFDRMAGGEHLHRFYNLWNSLNAKRGFVWEINPWVWVIEFKKI